MDKRGWLISGILTAFAVGVAFASKKKAVTTTPSQEDKADLVSPSLSVSAPNKKVQEPKEKMEEASLLKQEANKIRKAKGLTNFEWRNLLEQCNLSEPQLNYMLGKRNKCGCDDKIEAAKCAISKLKGE